MSRPSWGAPTREVATLVLRCLARPVDARALLGVNRFWRGHAIAHYAAGARDYLCSESNGHVPLHTKMYAATLRMSEESVVMLAMYWQRLKEICPGVPWSCPGTRGSRGKHLHDHIATFYAMGGALHDAMEVVDAERRIAAYPRREHVKRRKLEEAHGWAGARDIRMAKASLELLTTQYEAALVKIKAFNNGRKK